MLNSFIAAVCACSSGLGVTVLKIWCFNLSFCYCDSAISNSISQSVHPSYTPLTHTIFAVTADIWAETETETLFVRLQSENIFVQYFLLTGFYHLLT